jgi:hypothetical protein
MVYYKGKESMKDYAKFRLANGQHIVAIPKAVLEDSSLRAGDRLLVEATGPYQITITKEVGNAQAKSKRTDKEPEAAA